MEWILVQNEIPQKDRVICCGPGGGVFIGAYRGGYKVNELGEVICFAMDGAGFSPRRFVAWMPIPKLPESLLLTEPDEPVPSARLIPFVTRGPEGTGR